MKTKIDLQTGVKEVTITMEYEQYITLMAVLHESKLEDKYLGYQDDLTELIDELELGEREYVWDEI